MSISIHCPQCGKKLSAPDEAAGKRARCPQCKTIVTLPMPSEPPQDEILDAEPMAPELGADAPITPPPRQPGGGKFYPPSIPVDDSNIPLAPIAETNAPDQSGTPRRPCPMCGEMIPVGALQCRFCKEIFDPAMKKAAAKKAKQSSFSGGEGEDLTPGEWVLAILCSGIGCILGIIWIIQGKPKGKKMLGISVLCAIIWSVIRGVIESAAHGR